jgi:PKD repeat protein
LIRFVFPVIAGIMLAFFSVTADAAKNSSKDRGGNGGGSGDGDPLTCSIADPGSITVNMPAEFTASVSGGKPSYTVTWTFTKASPKKVTTKNVQPGDTTAITTFYKVGTQTVTLKATDKKKKTCSASLAVVVEDELPPPPVGAEPTARGDAYATPVGKKTERGSLPCFRCTL